MHIMPLKLESNPTCLTGLARETEALRKVGEDAVSLDSGVSVGCAVACDVLSNADARNKSCSVDQLQILLQLQASVNNLAANSVRASHAVSSLIFPERKVDDDELQRTTVVAAALHIFTLKNYVIKFSYCYPLQTTKQVPITVNILIGKLL